jgi:hypothetical protein
VAVIAQWSPVAHVEKASTVRERSDVVYSQTLPSPAKLTDLADQVAFAALEIRNGVPPSLSSLTFMVASLAARTTRAMGVTPLVNIDGTTTRTVTRDEKQLRRS